ncbi:hypothetical protein F5Y19DRAFT_492044 [Xylariaceae sp. FL1651]|nr:hypothetical protein F5Y19DRAFT_492044 [Xylariaceae sp. FL1651]
MDVNQHQANYSDVYQAPPQAISISKAWHNTKITFHALSIVFSIIVIGLSVALAVDVFNAHIFAFTVPQTGVAILFGAAELITTCVRTKHRGIHPGVHVAFHLVLWLGFVVGTGLASLTLDHDLNINNIYHDFDYRYYFSADFLSLIKATIVFLALLVIIHFVLFVRACVEMNQKKNAESQMVVMVSQPTYYDTTPMQPEYTLQQPPPSQQSQQISMQQQAYYPMQPQQAYDPGLYNRPTESLNHPADSSTEQYSFRPVSPVSDNGYYHGYNQPYDNTANHTYNTTHTNIYQHTYPTDNGWRQ